MGTWGRVRGPQPLSPGTRPPMSPLLILGFVALVLNAAYLAAGPEATLLYYLNIALHPALGLGLGAAVPVRWRREGAAARAKAQIIAVASTKQRR